MKKRIFAFWMAVAALVLATPASGQRKFDFVFVEGLNFSQLIGVDNTKAKAGVYSGLDVTYHFNDNWGINAGFGYSQQGTTCINNELSTLMNYNYNYVNFPLMATYRLPKYNLSFIGGLQLGWFSGASYDYTTPSILNPGEIVEGSGKFDSESFHPWELGATMGARWIFWPSMGIGIETRYTMGITQTHNGISTTANGNVYISVPDNRNSTFMFALIFLK
ncbi:MAG: PorT family protein [Tidjanibacter sp.]|nr:PorT family protein [Tidjanibacter sp.]